MEGKDIKNLLYLSLRIFTYKYSSILYKGWIPKQLFGVGVTLSDCISLSSILLFAEQPFSPKI